MKYLTAATRLLRHSSRNLFDRRFNLKAFGSIRPSSSGRNYTSLRIYEQFMQDDYFHRKIMSKNFCFLRGSGVGILHCLGKFQNNGIGTHHRNLASTALIPERNKSFATINSDDISYFKKVLGGRGVVQDEEKLDDANTDWMRKYKGSSKLMLQPRSTQEVSQILDYCNSRCLAVVPQGGNTGLVGGSIPVHDEVIINIGSMNNILSFDKVSGILVCEAGCILENLISFLDNEGYIMPLDLGAKGSCQIGGNVSTNAGGLRLLRYGSLHGSVLGSEGSLGIVTKVSILTPPKLSSVNLAFLACEDYLSCQKILLEAKRKLGEILSAFEFLDINAMDLVLKHIDGLRDPLPSSKHNFYVLIETTGSMESHDKEKLEAFLVQAIESELLTDGVVAQDINQASSFWRIREGVPEALLKEGATYKYDLSLPPEKMYDLVEEMRGRLGTTSNVVAYGHLGDGNLHLNISTQQYDDSILAKIEPFVYEWTSKQRGSISAEHGIGLMKASKIHYSKSAETVQVMAAIKKVLDPNGILNPYKVLPTSVLSQSGRHQPNKD
ncbi:D-2-hydroxyglutarate dehydrogenase, mitochondrial isoform X2 [Salvia miltiorrhiza]|uniref:D-2-hydroxyglutarate dehydrogenase, mitochondrial isoform X2 n=1 Tax=Salvia miltiorrhiza TaxID=226208 RepID=UPI0025ACC9DB|nr:D-2-hydroxyglutarate dehydrogenase, mitochondrial isoform X2 [Salvia miltiorrhiza]